MLRAMSIRSFMTRYLHHPSNNLYSQPAINQTNVAYRMKNELVNSFVGEQQTYSSDLRDSLVDVVKIGIGKYTSQM